MTNPTDFPVSITRADIDRIEAAAAGVNQSRNQSRRIALEILTQSRSKLADCFATTLEGREAALDVLDSFEATLGAIKAELEWIEQAKARLTGVVGEEVGHA